jgi:hypothetical protein
MSFSNGAFTYTITSSNTVSVKALNTFISGIITIPSNVTNGSTPYSVTSIENVAFSNCASLTSISITLDTHGPGVGQLL